MNYGRLSTAIQARGFALGTTLQMNTPEIAELQSAAGLDFVMIDMEHGALGIAATARLIRAVRAGGDAMPIVRQPNGSPAETAVVVAAGAHGVVAPKVESAAQLEAIVAAAGAGQAPVFI
jgi:2-keto-3-deoxy-L-rhamnonate aldolase RhmA